MLARRRDIACVLVNPLQALHPNKGAPSDGTLVDSSRTAGFDRAAYTGWLHRLADVCKASGIVLILDEVFVGFRLAPGGAAAYFGVAPDMITYGKTLGGGLPVGVLCGRAALMKRWRDDRPADICFARGTFNAHPYVMGAMDAFLARLDTPEVQALYDGLDSRWDARAAMLNARLAANDLPVRVAHLSTIWTVTYTLPSRYNWMLQYYLRAEGLALSWVGTGRLIFSLDYDDAAFAEVVERFVAAAARCRPTAGGGRHRDRPTSCCAGRCCARRCGRQLAAPPRSPLASAAPMSPGLLPDAGAHGLSGRHRSCSSIRSPLSRRTGALL